MAINNIKDKIIVSSIGLAASDAVGAIYKLMFINKVKYIVFYKSLTTKKA